MVRKRGLKDQKKNVPDSRGQERSRDFFDVTCETLGDTQAKHWRMRKNKQGKKRAEKWDHQTSRFPPALKVRRYTCVETSNVAEELINEHCMRGGKEKWRIWWRRSTIMLNISFESTIRRPAMWRTWARGNRQITMHKGEIQKTRRQLEGFGMAAQRQMDEVDAVL